MNICLISQEYPPETDWGGIATYTQTFARELFRAGEKVHVITYSPAKEYIADDMGVVVHRVSFKPKEPLRGLKKWIKNITLGDDHPVLELSQRVYEEVISIHKDEPLDVIEAPETCAQGLMTYRFMHRVKKITHLHTPFFWVRQLNQIKNTPEALRRDYLERKQAKLSTMVICPTQSLANIVVKNWGIKDIQVIPYPFSMRYYVPDMEIFHRYLKDQEYILYFGRLEVRKGVHVLAEALREVFKKNTIIKAAFVGNESTYNEGSMKEHLQSILGDFKNRVIFIEHAHHNALYPIIEKSKLVVLPSLWENFPYACLEAMALGKVVITSSGGGFSEIIDDRISGFLFSPGDAKMLSRTILHCLQRNDLEQIGENAIERIKKIEAEKNVRQRMELYRKA